MNLILGCLVVVGSLAGGFLWAGGHLLALFQPAELLIIGGAALGAFVISNPLRSLKECWHSLPQLLKMSRYSKDYYLTIAPDLRPSFYEVEEQCVPRR